VCGGGGVGGSGGWEPWGKGGGRGVEGVKGRWKEVGVLTGCKVEEIGKNYSTVK